MDPVMRKNGLLKKLRNKQITMDEFLCECAQWALEEINACHFLALPVKPKQVEGYESLPDSVKANLAQEYFKDHPKVMEYYERVGQIKYHNRVLYDWLSDCMSRVVTEEGKLLFRKKLDEVSVEQLW